MARERGEKAILGIHQLPDSRRAILAALKRQGCATIAQLADELELTGEAVRQQLLQLQRDGWIESKIDRAAHERGRTGRPATTYSLTDAGDHLFPKSYDALGVAMLDAVANELGPEATKRMLGRVCDDRVAQVAPAIRGLPLADRVEALKSLYIFQDPYMEAEKTEDGFRLVERNCPFYNVAMRRPAICSISVNALTRLLGVRVEREERFQAGDGRCVFRVYADEPVDAERWQFRLESEK
ncbi:MAG TPA: winged helix-turn-helix transcriptional regulator [Thermoanaerobaculia bacterium]|nr:winged helix-turn-helix transcriptional regulator [Thermoanaerobaculia bacterium]